MALKPEPTAPFHSAQDALRVLETVAQHTTGVTDAQIARETGLGRTGSPRLLLRCCAARATSSRSPTARTSSATP